jgi:hypothetical protein
MSARQRTQDRQRKTCLFGFLQKTCFACQAYPAQRLRAVAGSRDLGVPLAEYAASLRFQTSAPPNPRRAGHEPHLTFRRRSWWSLSGSNRRPEACKATALPAELRPRLDLASVAGRDVRPFGFPRHEARRPVGLRKSGAGSTRQRRKPDRAPATSRRTPR